MTITRHFRTTMQTKTTRALLGALAILAGAQLAACGGGGEPTKPITKPDTTGTVTPPPPPAQTLRTLAAAKGRYFGVALDAAFFRQTATYDSLIAREFNMVVAGNVMKWEPLLRNGRNAYRWANPDYLVSFAQARGMKARGHTLAWHQQNPTWLTAGNFAADTLRKLLRDHVDSVVGHYRGKIHAWDVVNEALNDGTGSLRTAGSPWAPALGVEYLDIAFRQARAADPTALLFYNDYSLEFPGAKQDSAFALIQGMKARGVPIDGIGFQAHFQINENGTGVPSQQSLVATFTRFAALGLKVELTELDIRVRNSATAAELAAQAKGYGDVVAACLAVAACDAIVVWGVNDAESWIMSTFPGYGRPLLFDDAFNRKDTYTAVRNALGGA
jgi:endo-1,4-beta-xylanase